MMHIQNWLRKMVTSQTSLLIIGHAQYASSIESSIKMIVGDVENVYYLDFQELDTNDTLKEKITKKLNKIQSKSILIVADLVGGAPFQVSSFLSMEDQRLNVIGGVNLSSILEVIFSLDQDLDTIAKIMLETTQETVKILKTS